MFRAWVGANDVACGEDVPVGAQALVNAYDRNPRIDAERARLRATDEEVPMAISG